MNEIEEYKQEIESLRNDLIKTKDLLDKKNKVIEELKKEIMKNKFKNFLNEINKLSKEYNLSISHEDSHGGFIIENYDPVNISWLSDARIEAYYN